MNKIPNRLTDETGSVLVIALLMLVFLTLLGIASTTTTSIELQIAQNERIYQNHFNAAEAAALHAIQWVADASDLEDFSDDEYSNYKLSPWNGDAEAALNDFRDPSDDVWGVGANSKSAAMLVEDGSGNVMYPNTRFAIVFAGTAAEETLDETSEEVVNIYHCFGLYRVPIPGDPDRGEVIIEIGYKRRS